VGVRVDARPWHLKYNALGVSLFWDTYRYREVVSVPMCDPGPCSSDYRVPGDDHGGREFGSRLGAGVSLQIPFAETVFGDIGALAGRFTRSGAISSGFKALADEATSSAFLGLEAGLTKYWGSIGAGGSYEYSHGWRVRGVKPTAHRIRVRLAYVLPYTSSARRR
jgi:hypothetical protein